MTITRSAGNLSATVEFPPPTTGARRAGTAASRPSSISNNSSVESISGSTMMLRPALAPLGMLRGF